jgi:immune inhibitor A
MKRKLFATLAVLVLLVAALPAAAGAARSATSGIYDDPDFGPKEDNRPDPLTTQQQELKQQALDAKLNGKAYGKTHEVARGQFVELAREGEDPVWTVLGEFNGEDTTCVYPGEEPWECTNPMHNMIAEPDRAVDNTTFWVEDFNRDHYLDMLFSEGKGVNSMRQFYIENSSNRYTVYGDVTDWAMVPNDACSYDDDISNPGDAENPEGGNAVWYFIRDTVNAWYQNELDAGKSPEQINEYLSQFDIWDRYDFDGDGNFNEPDGYIDHMNILHAGEGNEAGGGALGDCAIWSHSWFAFPGGVGSEGPSADFLEGGLQIGDSDFWLNKYIINPENGGVGVFAHEYGHDLGLPDLYNTGGGPENSTGFWSLMSSGSWLDNGEDYIGTRPGHMGGWEKFQLGWLNYEVASAGQKSAHKIGPAETNTKQAQGVFVILPPKEVTEQIADPYAGEYFYYSGAGNNLDNLMYKSFTLPAGATLAAKANVQIELDWDYAYLVYSTDGGATWIPIETNLSTDTDPNGQNFGHGITGNSGGWVDLTANLPEGDMLLGFRYWTDVAAVEPGFMVDDIAITGYETDGAESDTGWEFEGFRTTTGTETGYYNNYYLAEFRQYRGYDETLEVGPYNFGFLDNQDLGNWVEHFPYQDGLMVSYWDTSQSNNNTASHPGEGLILPVDAHPGVMYRADGGVWRNRIQTYDSTFGLEPTEALTLHWLSQPSEHPSLPAVPVFDDSNSYWDPANPTGSVIVPNTGTTIRIVNYSAHGNFLQIVVNDNKKK